jgi:peptidoglycan/xylan/chitin deacetylase (PgdA/CDA1 family)
MQQRPFVYAVLAALFLFGVILALQQGAVTHAAATNPAPAAKISFTFDDGLASALTQAKPTLAKYGLTGTSYVITKCIGMTTAPNTCHANTDARYMSWTQVKQLQAAGWEIGSHTQTHPYLATSDATDGQPNVLTPAQVTTELAGSKADLAAQGITATAFSTPYGDYSNATLAQIAQYYTSHRGFADQNTNIWPYNDYLLNNMPVQSGVTVAQVKTKIDAAIAGKQWLILTMHDIAVSPSTNPDDYQYSTANLDQIAAYVKTKQSAGLITPVNISQGLVTTDANLLPGSSFDGGITNGWTTDAPTKIVGDNANNGSTPSPTSSVKLTATTINSHLFSPTIAIDPNTTYMLKNFLKVTSITSSVVGFYIDEYDGAGNWISGQYKNGESAPFVENFNFTYKPTSTAVRKARLQVIVPANSGITAYIDNPQWFSLSTTTPPVQTNLVANGTFDAGIANGWTTDDATHITANTANHGSPANPVNSVALTSTTQNKHLFSPKITVDPAKNYTLTNYLNLLQISSGEVGFYIDEYDAAGNWISGQYKTGVRGVSTGDVSFQYKPTSTNVKTASLQIIVTANANISAYFDDVRWYQQ